MTTSNLPPVLENRRIRWEPVFPDYQARAVRPGDAWEARIGEVRLELGVRHHLSGTGVFFQLRLVGREELARWEPPTLETAAWVADAVYELLEARITVG